MLKGPDLPGHDVHLQILRRKLKHLNIKVKLKKSIKREGRITKNKKKNEIILFSEISSFYKIASW